MKIEIFHKPSAQDCGTLVFFYDHRPVFGEVIVAGHVIHIDGHKAFIGETISCPNCGPVGPRELFAGMEVAEDAG